MSNLSPGRPSEEADIRFGLICGAAAYALWGLFPIYFKAVEGASAFEILAHRIVWSAPFGALVLFARKQWPEVATAFASRRIVLMLALSATAIASNWGVYVWAVVHHHVLQASLGYYINPLMYVAAGVFVMGERLRPAQMAALALAAAGVLVPTVIGGHFPFVAVALAALFTAYGYIRKTTPVGAMPGLFIETIILAPFALGFIIWLGVEGGAVFGAGDFSMSALLALAGPFTVIPLVAFALAARRLRLSTIGFLQYIAPTGQFLLGLYYGEAFTLASAICFGLIWTALLIFSVDAVRANRDERKARAAAAGLAALNPAASAPPKSS